MAKRAVLGQIAVRLLGAEYKAAIRILPGIGSHKLRNLVEHLLQVCTHLALGIEPERGGKNVCGEPALQPALKRSRGAEGSRMMRKSAGIQRIELVNRVCLTSVRIIVGKSIG